ncbi:hypothetical protein PHSC3_000490 [Chlamydiales bacterium STE3]|nr:hypothetical protein PHSC3_000490 [Chlamydiales bacterium STE3]
MKDFNPIKITNHPYEPSSSHIGAKALTKKEHGVKSSGRMTKRLEFAAFGHEDKSDINTTAYRTNVAFKNVGPSKRNSDNVPKLNFIEKRFYVPLLVQKGTDSLDLVWVLVNKSSLSKRFNISKEEWKEVAGIKNPEKKQEAIQALVKAKIKQLKSADNRKASSSSTKANSGNRIKKGAAKKIKNEAKSGTSFLRRFFKVGTKKDK